MPALLSLKAGHPTLEQVLGDPGYSLCTTDTWHDQLRRAGLKILHKPVTHQRGQHPTVDGMLLVDDTFLHPATPPALLGTPNPNGTRTPLPYPQYGDDDEARARCQAPFDRRARWRMRLHKVTPDGTYWFRCPFCAGSLSATDLTVHSGRRPGPRATPVTHAVQDLSRCCDGLVPVKPGQLGRWQETPAGTTAHYTVFHGRRQSVELTNSLIKALITNLDDKHALVFGTTKRSVLLGFTLAAYNHRVGNAWAVDHAKGPAADNPNAKGPAATTAGRTVLHPDRPGRPPSDARTTPKKRNWRHRPPDPGGTPKRDELPPATPHDDTHQG